jgi:toxin ParE1/3/4
VKVSLHPAAESDIEEAAEFYERTGSPALAAKFVAEFKRVANLLLEFPGIGSPRPRGRQGFSMSMFPYTVIYRSSITGNFVLVVKHDSRRPSYGGSRK